MRSLGNVARLLGPVASSLPEARPPLNARLTTQGRRGLDAIAAALTAATRTGAVKASALCVLAILKKNHN